jgi:prepilin-type N-terminal cleavage/methylation domain-containing protein
MRSILRKLPRLAGFTLVELLTVMAVIAILAGLVLSISGYATKRGATARAGAEIRMLSAGCESYKADDGIYPDQALAQSGTVPSVARGTTPSDQLDARQYGISAYTTKYQNSSLELYEALTGDLSLNGTGGGVGVTNYVPDLRQDSLDRSNPNAAVSSANQVLYLSDPYGNSYGYSTAYATSTVTGTATVSGYPSTTSTYPGYNATFDLWSTAGSLSNPTPGQTGDPSLGWITNWRQY